MGEATSLLGSMYIEVEVEVGLGEYAMAERLGACMDSTEHEPDGCPQSSYAYGDVRNLSWELTTPPTVDYSYFDPSFPMSLSTSDGEATATYEVDDSYGYGPKQWTK